MKDVFELVDHLANQLMRHTGIIAGFFALEFMTGTTDGVALFIEQ